MECMTARFDLDTGSAADVVVLADTSGRPVGTAPRLEVHTATTPIHLAYSTYLRRPDGKVLLTRRALSKKTWPGVWTNTACGHLRPGETARGAALRRVPEEIGATPENLVLKLPRFRYRAVDASGVVENEFCPVFVGEVNPDRILINPDEVAEVAWVEWADLQRIAATAPALISPWAVMEIGELGDDPWADTADVDPEAAPSALAVPGI